MDEETAPISNGVTINRNDIRAVQLAKAAIAAMGFGDENLRMPLTRMEDATRAKLFDEMRKLGIQV